MLISAIFAFLEFLKHLGLCARFKNNNNKTSSVSAMLLDLVKINISQYMNDQGNKKTIKNH